MIDYIIIGIIVFSVIVSLLRGFVREVMSLASWIVAFFIASNFYVYLAGLKPPLNPCIFAMVLPLPFYLLLH